MGQTELLKDLCGMADVDPDCDIIDDEFSGSMNLSNRNNEIQINEKMINGGIQSTNTTSIQNKLTESGQLKFMKPAYNDFCEQRSTEDIENSGRSIPDIKKIPSSFSSKSINHKIKNKINDESINERVLGIKL